MLAKVIYGCNRLETFAKPSGVDAVQGVAAQRMQTYHIDRQTSGQRTTQKCAADGSFSKVSICLQSQMMTDDEADFAVKQYGGIGLDTQDIGSGTCGYFQHKILEQLSLYRLF